MDNEVENGAGNGAASAPAAAPDDVRRRLALSLDVDDLVAAERLAKELRPWFGVAKVGLELYSAAGPDAITAMTELGYTVFCDLKLHDIPNTVERASRVLGALGVRYLTLHAAGGVSMLRAGVEGLLAGATDGGLPAPIALGVTVLTSEAEATHHTLATRVSHAVEADCSGVVCGVPDLPTVRQLAPRLLCVVPGIRPPGTPTQDQARVGTPQEAIAAGADLLVIGRAVTGADDAPAAAAALTRAIGGDALA